MVEAIFLSRKTEVPSSLSSISGGSYAAFGYVTEGMDVERS